MSKPAPAGSSGAPLVKKLGYKISIKVLLIGAHQAVVNASSLSHKSRD